MAVNSNGGTGRFNNYRLDARVVPLAQVRGLVDSLDKRGIPLERQLEHTGIEIEHLADAGRLFSYAERLKQLSNMLRLTADPGHWLVAQREVSVSEYGLLGYAMMSSATLDRAVHIAVKYHKMAGALFELTFLKEHGHAILRIEHLLARGEVAQYVVEDLFLNVTQLISLLVGKPVKPAAIRLNYPEPDVTYDYEPAFGCPVSFGQAYSEYCFDASMLNQPLAEADPDTARICEESCQSLLEQMKIQEDLVSGICHLLLRTPGDFPKLDVIAAQLSMGGRTLRRRLTQLGTSYQQVLDDVKRELAVEYLQTTNLTVQQISDLLGYSEVTNFRRAFVKWVDVSPYKYRKSLDAPRPAHLL